MEPKSQGHGDRRQNPPGFRLADSDAAGARSAVPAAIGFMAPGRRVEQREAGPEDSDAQPNYREARDGRADPATGRSHEDSDVDRSRAESRGRETDGLHADRLDQKVTRKQLAAQFREWAAKLSQKMDMNK